METACSSKLSAPTHRTPLVFICILFYDALSNSGNLVLLLGQIMCDGMQRTSEGSECILIEVKIMDI
jgi:hypothetical protein